MSTEAVNPMLIDAFCARRSGRTTRQMQAAPYGAIYVSVTGGIECHKALAHHLGRDDLIIKSPIYFEGQWRGRTTPFVLDHAAFSFMNFEQREGYFECRAYLTTRGIIGDDVSKS